ncbi:hypothetical protein B2G71_20300 [Novosphingobium sp. PC22D]|uniref:energy transducer TonB family protein n=1 Tax=Novosphingobium sp. PC22D TaxID=1962403 RepID=UPI000BFAC2F2|nr:energy transducer TonB [Novosphingobium sp. PC22D]PEQ10810.1 hypothetical protein B2G71_20300 [Novosphingobium sp. PC22D]
MIRAETLSGSGYRPGSPRQRAVSIVLSLGVMALLALLALLFQAHAPIAKRLPNLTTFSTSDSESAAAPKAEQKKPEAKRPKVVQKEAEPPKLPKAPRLSDKTEVREEGLDSIPGFIKMDRKQFAAADISKMQGPPDTGGGAGSDGSGLAMQGPGEGPGGVRLYNADWYRKPTHAQLATYMPRNGARTGWGLIACRTIEDYRVEDCQILGESPRGSGFGRAVQEAAWQFRVVPPKVNAKPQIGAWVRIRIDYTERGSEAG